MPPKRLHPVYRVLAGVLGLASLVISVMVITGAVDFGHRIGDVLSGVFIGGLFLYCAITGNQLDYKPESRHD